ncbi:MAG: InlB B-repeat-containing protein, partial [Kiritimatiellaeota bacterium]|nr:InlB B-repeat-containing protein [Kiritimatiellota bacterium]
MKASRIMSAMVAALTLATGAANAATVNVSGGGAALQNAVASAKAGDVIKVGPGTYSPITCNNLKIRIESTGGAAATIIDGGGTQRCATLKPFELFNSGLTNTVLVGFTLQNGYTFGTEEGVFVGQGGFGGGVYGGTLADCVVTRNKADGFGFFITAGGGAKDSMLINCTLTHNEAYQAPDGYTTFGWGGGADSCWLHNCTLTDNTATGGGGVSYSDLYNCTLRNNTATSGGGAYCSWLYTCVVSDNTAKDLVGGSAGEGGGANNCSLFNCVITGNSAYWGGGVAWCEVELVISCLIANNRAVGYSAYGHSYNEPECGGAFNAYLNNCTITGNSSSYAMGGVGGCRVNNCIVTGNTAPVFPNYHPGEYYAPGGYWWVSSVFYNCCISPALVNPEADRGGNIAADPMFVGGGDYHLQAGSPCIDKGRNVFLDCDNTTRAITSKDTDLDGRPRIQGGIVDMGAYEYAPPVTVVVTFDANGGTPASEKITQTVSGQYILPSPAPTRAGYRLTGWFTAKTGGDQVTAATPVAKTT